jgi:phosphotransferase system  glucose/maltose/N-acetylglucosamine-specific IIC component
MKLSKKWRPYLFAAIMAFAMGFFMSLILTWVNTGLTNGFLDRWLNAFGVGICVAFPISILIAPHANSLLNRVVNN